MGHSQAEKAQNRERILKKAAEQIRDTGLESVSVGPLMRSVNLTHGGFYGHFASRSELLAHALERALREGEAASKAARNAAAAKAAKSGAAAASGSESPGKPADDSARPASYATLLRSYLSRAHRDARKSGCAIAALASDVARADDTSREVMEAHVERFVQNVKQAMGTHDEERALLAASAMVGGLLLSRIVTDPKRSDQILRAVRDGLADIRDQGTAPQ